MCSLIIANGFLQKFTFITDFCKKLKYAVPVHLHLGLHLEYEFSFNVILYVTGNYVPVMIISVLYLFKKYSFHCFCLDGYSETHHKLISNKEVNNRLTGWAFAHLVNYFAHPVN